jgi:hypothetical protein
VEEKMRRELIKPLEKAYLSGLLLLAITAGLFTLLVGVFG